ncbi:MAG: class I SAM-dependent methyltransferase [Lachnospiraceae bacterium]|nr:class I SAM-dependent methyltransferase [Lachnospiraceae bacterium]
MLNDRTGQNGREDPESKWDRRLGISTAGRDASAEDAHHFPYEPTPYCVLERLAESGLISEENVLVDYGCGKGRVNIFMSSRTGCHGSGIEFDPDFLSCALQNLEASAVKDKVVFRNDNAEKFEVPAEADRFYFFNPFSEKILHSVIGKIIASWYKEPRRILLMFYYPSDEYVGYLMGVDELSFLDEIDCSDLFPNDPRERILCFETL